MVERYNCYGWDIRRGEMRCEDDGEYVRHSDYADLERQIVELREERDEARRHCSGKDKVAKAYYDNWRDAEAENARLRALPLKDEVERCAEIVEGWAEVLGALPGSPIHSALYDAANAIRRDPTIRSRLRAGEQEGWRSMDSAPKDGTPIWAFLHESGIRLIHWVSPENTAEELGGDPSEYDGVWAELDDHSEQWGPDFWLPQDALPASPSVSEGGGRNG